MKLDRRLEGRSAAVEEGLNHIADFAEYISRHRPALEGFLDYWEREALQLVAEHEGRVCEAESRLAAERAALAEAERRLTVTQRGAEWFRSAINEGVTDEARYEKAMREAAELDGFPYLDTKTIPMPFFKAQVKAALPNGVA